MTNVKKGGFALHLVKARHVDEERLKSRRLQAWTAKNGHVWRFWLGVDDQCEKSSDLQELKEYVVKMELIAWCGRSKKLEKWAHDGSRPDVCLETAILVATVVTHFDKFQVSPSGMLLQLFLNPIGELSLWGTMFFLPRHLCSHTHTNM